MKYSSAQEVLNTLIDSYYSKRDTDLMFSCMTDDVTWVGTEKNDVGQGKSSLRPVIEEDMSSYPDTIRINIISQSEQHYGNDIVFFTVTGEQIGVPGRICGYSFRGTVSCVRTESGWLVNNIHVSVPNLAMEKYSLEKELDEIANMHLREKLESATQELKKKYDLEKRRSQDDKSIMAFAVFNLTSGKTIEIDRRVPLLPVIRLVGIEEFSQNIALNIPSAQQKESFLRLFMKQQLMEQYRSGRETQSVEFQRLLPNGKTIWVESTFHVMLEPDGTDILLFYNCHDINMRKNIEMMTAYITDEDYDMIACCNFNDNTAIIMYGKNSLIYADKKDRIQYEENYSKVVDMFVDNAVVPEEREQLYSEKMIPMLRNNLINQDIKEFIVHVCGPDGRLLTKKMRYSLIDSESGMYFFSQTDISKQVEEEDKRQQVLRNAFHDAKKANETMFDFYSSMSHDLRTPMNGILGLAELSEDCDDVNELKDNIYKIKESGQYLLGLINHSLDYQKIHGDQVSLDTQVISARKLLEEVTGIIRLNAEKKGVNFNIVSESVNLDCYINVDSKRVKQIFVNLLSNAVKFTPPGGTVALTIETTKRTESFSHCIISVSDTGIGMSPDFINNGIFKPFSQEHNVITDQYAGTGLGLSITKRIVELMGASISVESKLGVGTRYTLEFDFESVKKNMCDRPTESKEIMPENIRSLDGKNILIVEDHPLNAEIAVRLLKKVGCTVTWAKNGKECTSIFADSAVNQFDMILMDIRMPVMNGLEAACAIRAEDRPDAGSVPIIAMTANAYDDDIKKSLDSGMNAHLAKPIDPKSLYGIMMKFI